MKAGRWPNMMTTLDPTVARGDARAGATHDPQSVRHPDDRVPDHLQRLPADLFARLFVHRFPRLDQGAGQFRRPEELPRPADRSVHLVQLHHHREVRDRLGDRPVGRRLRPGAAAQPHAFRCKGLVTTLLLLPMMLSMAVVGLFWKLLYDPNLGASSTMRWASASSTG